MHESFFVIAGMFGNGLVRSLQEFQPLYNMVKKVIWLITQPAVLQFPDMHHVMQIRQQP